MVTNLENTDILSLPSLPINDRKNLPKSSGLYFVISREEIIYIGVSANIRERWLLHHKLEMILDFDSVKIAWLIMEGNINLGESERNAIDFFKPRLNNAKGCYPLVRRWKLFGKAVPKGIKIKLQEILEKKEKSLYWLAKETGISYNALAKINKNEVSRLELDTIEKICVQLGCSTGELFAIEK